MTTADGYSLVIKKTTGMVRDKAVQRLAEEHGLHVLDVTWEDTARFDFSAVGPNISDMTIQVQHQIPGREDYELSCMPVIRYPNFSDISGDISPDEFFLLVGNEKGQSRAGDPAVLAILATREGTSVTVIDNARDGFEAGDTWGQRLFFNQNGERASLTGQRKSDFLAEQQRQQMPAVAADEQADREGLNMVLLIQVPLKQKEPMKYDTLAGFDDMDTGIMYCCAPAPSDVEEAVIGHGKVEGPFTEIDGLEIERDDRYPIRVTVQFYKATSNGVVSEEDMADIAAQINKVYKQADYVGSLVVEGRTGRPTEYAGLHDEPPDWWDVFWKRHFENTGQSREEAMEMLGKLLGKDWGRGTLAEAEKAVAEAGQPVDGDVSFDND